MVRFRRPPEGHIYRQMRHIKPQRCVQYFPGSQTKMESQSCLKENEADTHIILFYRVYSHANICNIFFYQGAVNILLKLHYNKTLHIHYIYACKQLKSDLVNLKILFHVKINVL